MYSLAENTQKRIESLYDVKLIKRVGNSITNKTKHVEDFIGEDKKTRYITYKNKEYGSTHGKILKNKLETLVYIHPGVIKNLKENNPFKSLNERNTPYFLVFAEEIDHGVYLNAKFELEKIPSKFELELQAAVTKYLLAAWSILSKGKSATRFMSDYKDKLNKDSLNFLMKNVFPPSYLKLDKNKINIGDIIKGEDYLVADLLARDYCKYLTKKGINIILLSLRKFYWMDEKEKADYVMKDFETNPVL